ncbi:unnamed protein product [Cylindrotheca closterium]|uniref:Uncharacterized protein n=1 Tax=Cylindrotheca closterium TaxID=2856 RepID=A0AAD2CGN7_9STRA|nr:unnamed protein product [Cylindrotheca closterium]
MKGTDTSIRKEERVCGCLQKRKTGKDDLLPSFATRLMLVGFAVLHNGLLGGVLFGWASIDQTLLGAPLEEGGAGLNLKETARIFSWASSLNMFSPFLLGMVLDRFGPRVAATVASMTVTVGSLVFASTSHFWGFVAAALLISLGGPGVASCIIHISNLFPGNENLVMATLTGSVAFSFSLFAIFDDLWSQWNLTLPELFRLYAGIAFLLGIGSLILYPDEPYKQHAHDDQADHITEEEKQLLSTKTKQLLTIHEGEEDALAATTDRHHHHHHHHPHIESAMTTSSLHIEQPLNSYLRDEKKMFTRSESFLAVKKAMEANDKELVKAVGLKDQPFFVQILSPTYLRATFVFMVTSFATNFYVVSISTELADAQIYNAATQHQLARNFTVIMATGAFISIPIGWLIDELGVEVCTFVTLIMGQLQMLLLIFGAESIICYTISFWVYTLFRQFLYPVYISSLTSRLGFKYFGVLLGIGFGLGGVAQLFLYPLDVLVQGNCRLQDENTMEAEECSNGYWAELNVIQTLILLVLWVVPFLDDREKRQREQKIKEILSQRLSTTYGTSSD